MFNIQRVAAYDTRPGLAARYAEEMGSQLGLSIEAVDRPEKAVRDMDLIVTSGPILKKPHPVIEAEWVSPGAFASPVDFDSYWKPAALRQFDLLATDDKSQFQYYRKSGYFQKTPAPYADLGELAAGRRRGRSSDRQRTASINLGLALEDMATAVRIYENARARGIGRELPL